MVFGMVHHYIFIHFMEMFLILVYKYMKNSSNYNVEYRDGIKSKGDKIGMPCTESTVII